MSLLEKIRPGEEAAIDPAKQLIRAGDEQGAGFFDRLSWRLRRFSLPMIGRKPPLKLASVPKDPVAGDKAAGEALMKGALLHRGDRIPVDRIDFGRTGDMPRDLADRLHSFAWLRDLAAAATRERAAKRAERIVQAWLAAHGSAIAEPAWRPDNAGRRILFWSAYAPYILSTRDVGYRAAVLRHLAQASRHLDKCADRAPAGLARVTAWAGLVASALVLQGGPARLGSAEAGLIRALGVSLTDDGGLVSRAPVEQLTLVETLAQLRAAYNAGHAEVPEPVLDAMAGAVGALLGTTLGDEALSSWQGGNPLSKRRIAAAVEGSGVRARPLRQARGWGYQRIEAKSTLLVLDAAPPPGSRGTGPGSASTLAFEMSDGPNRFVVNCGGPGTAVDALPAELVRALRTTAAHSTLALGDRNSTAILEDGTLGKGVGQVELVRDETGGVATVEASHDGYVKRFGLTHQRQLILSADGRELRGQDVLAAAGRRRKGEPVPFALRFHLAPAVEAATTADGQGALLRIRGATVWQFRCRGGRLAIEESLWIDGDGAPQATTQLVVTGDAPADGATIGWVFRRAG
jgi:uncharacterized heparinase superfamily protein